MLLVASSLLASVPSETIRNEKLVVGERTLAPGETFSWPGKMGGGVVFLDAGSVVTTADQTTGSHPAAIKRGDTAFAAIHVESIKNTGASPVRFVWFEYVGTGGSEIWGTAGLAPHYTLLSEDRYGRVYDIKIPAGTDEPLHTHHDRVVVCLSGANLMHEMPDGRKETSTLKTGEIAWRRGGTHVGHNLGKTDLWVIAIEPK